ncbi:MAG: hypothetical protein KDD67_13870 [Ignavibacteriae bacterium]|nr:hypothetical protein [Ignavibacteriota bacterium]MCB9216125.1 hypothetical protein [Ignavibacteria bacterium]
MEERLVKLEQTVRMQRLMMLGLFVVLCGGVVMGFDKEKKIASYEQLEVQTLVVHSKKLGAMGDSDVEVIRIGSDMDGHGLIELHGYDGNGGHVTLGLDRDSQPFVGVWGDDGKHQWHGPPDSAIRFR